MKDTADDVDAAYLRRFATLSPLQRLQMMSDMFETAKALIEADIRRHAPDIRPQDLRVETFKRLYWDDFDEATRTRLIATL